MKQIVLLIVSILSLISCSNNSVTTESTTIYDNRWVLTSDIESNELTFNRFEGYEKVVDAADIFTFYESGHIDHEYYSNKMRYDAIGLLKVNRGYLSKNEVGLHLELTGEYIQKSNFNISEDYEIDISNTSLVLVRK